MRILVRICKYSAVQWRVQIIIFVNSLLSSSITTLIMVDVWNRVDHYIFALWFLLSFFLLSFFPRLISAVVDWIPYFYTWCGPCANLECRSEMCLDGNAGPKNRPKIPVCVPSHNFVKLYLATKACIDNRKKLVKQQYLIHMSSQYGEIRLTGGWDRSSSLGHCS